MIRPILTYNSKVWGAFVKSDFKSWEGSGIEKKNTFTFLLGGNLNFTSSIVFIRFPRHFFSISCTLITVTL